MNSKLFILISVLTFFGGLTNCKGNIDCNGYLTKPIYEPLDLITSPQCIPQEIIIVKGTLHKKNGYIAFTSNPKNELENYLLVTYDVNIDYETILQYIKTNKEYVLVEGRLLTEGVFEITAFKDSEDTE